MASALVFALSAGTAAAHKQTYESTLQLKVDAPSGTSSQYSGQIISDKSACESGRSVTITVNGVTIATANSVAGGAWSTTGPAQVKGATVIATIPRKFLKRTKKHKHKCAADFVERKAK